MTSDFGGTFVALAGRATVPPPPPSPHPTLQMLYQMTRAAITHAHVCHLIKIPPSELCLQLLQRRWCVISAERRSPLRMLWRPTGKLTQVLCRHVRVRTQAALAPNPTPRPKHSVFPFIFRRTRISPAGLKLVGRLKLSPAQLFHHLSQRSDTRFPRNLSDAFRMSTKHSCEMTAFPLSDVFSPLALSHSRKHGG